MSMPSLRRDELDILTIKQSDSGSGALGSELAVPLPQPNRLRADAKKPRNFGHEQRCLLIHECRLRDFQIRNNV
jgi:hypothetical protein